MSLLSVRAARPWVAVGTAALDLRHGGAPRRFVARSKKHRQPACEALQLPGPDSSGLGANHAQPAAFLEGGLNDD